MVRATTAVTPIIQTRRQKMTCGSELISPPTPHRIELREGDDVNGCKKPMGRPQVAVAQPATKARRRLNNNHVEKTLESKDNHKLTEYFPVRRSVRKTKTTVLEEKQLALEKALRTQLEEGLEVRYFDGKGRGVVAAKDFDRGDFVVEYSGDLIDIVEAKRREEKYAQNENTGCYMYYFRHNNQQYCIDATAETGRLGRLVNHSRAGNLATRVFMVDGLPRLVLVARDRIRTGEEVLYDYGDRSREALKHHPWLAA